MGIDQDSKQIENCKLKIENYKNRVILVCDSYANLKKIVEKNKFGSVNGILLDLGMSSWQLEESGRGFSFLRDEPLDMRYGAKYQISNIKCQNYLTAEEIVNKWPKEEIERILKEYGEERFFRTIAEEIIRKRKSKPIKTTLQLVEIIKKAVPYKYQVGRIHCATQTIDRN